MTTPPGGTLRVLFVGTKEDAARTNGQLRRAGYEISSGRVETEAGLVAAVESDHWDIVICQSTTTDLDAPSVLLRVKRRRPHLPVIIISPLFGESVAAAAMSAGADDFLADGFLARLPAAVEREVRSARMRRELDEASRTLREAEERSNAFLDNSPALAWMKDEEGRLVYVNAEWQRVFGLPLEEVRGRTDFQWLPAPVAAQVRANDQAVLASGRTLQFEESLPTADGIREWLVFKFPFRDASARRFVGGVAIDITERKRAEEELRDTRQFFEQIIASAGEGIIVYDRDLRYVLWNRFMEELTGMPRESVIGRRPREVFAHVEEHGIDKLLEKALAGEKVVSPDYCYRIRESGRSGWVSSTFAPHRNARGDVVGVIGIIEDITERKRSEEALRENQAFLEKAQEVGRMGSWVSGVGSEASLVWSKETCRIFDVPPEAFDGRVETFFSLVHPEDLRSVQDAVEAAIAGGGPYAIDHRILRRDGSIRWVHERADIVRDERGEPTRMVGIVQDITERTRLEQQFLQSQKMEAIGRLAGGVAHDFNNLLTAILGYADLLLSQIPEHHAMRGDLEEIQKAGERASSLTQQLLAFSRRQILEPRVLDVNAIVTSLGSMLCRLIGEDIELVTRLEPRLGRVRADPGQLEQVILNLAVNSRDAMPGGGMLTIETHGARISEPLNVGQAAIPPGAYSILSVRDTGTGMDAATQARLFEPFFTTKEQGKGTGLGLATAYGIVKQSGGYILCETALGKGTVFKIYLPAYSGAVEAKEAAIPPAPTRPIGADRTVLLVEDEDGVRRLSRRVLEAGGFEVLEAAGGEQALAIAHAHPGPIHLLLTDVVMPGWRGPEVAARIEEVRPGIQVLYLSGYADVELGPEAILLQKPFPPETLAAKVDEALRVGRGATSEVLRSAPTSKR